MENPETANDITHQYFDLNMFTEAQFIEFMLSYYWKDVNEYFIASFTADANFRMLVYRRWIFIRVENIHPQITEYLGSQKYSMYSYGSKSSVFAFYCEKGILGVNDFEILKELWKLVRYIKRIEIESHNVIFKRFSPESLECLCLHTIKANKLRLNLPLTVLNRLGLVEVS